MKIAPNPPAAPEQWIPFDDWLSQFGRTRQTGHRWRQQLPWLKVRNILGRVYISATSARRFSELAAAGELAIHHTPPPPRVRSANKTFKEATV
jgi:hypothetical protein